MTARLVTHVFLSWALIFSNPAVANLVELAISYDTIETDFERLESFAKKVRAEIRKSVFDQEALIGELDYGHEEIIDFVKRQVTFEQYPGVMRGAKGTLLARAGNSVDQSLLLATLLKDAGYDARLARTVLPLESTHHLLAQMAPTKATSTLSENPDRIVRLFEEYGIIQSPAPQVREALAAGLNHQPPPWVREEFDSMKDIFEGIHGTLESANVALESEATMDEIMEEARDYFWVQYKDSASDPWTDIHPSFTESVPFELGAPGEFFGNELPEELLHHLQFQVFIERRVKNTLEVQPVSGAWKRPVANLIGTPLVFSNIPDSMTSSEAAKKTLDEILDSTNFFIPTFGHGTVEDAQYFDLQGTLIDPMVASDQAAGIFREVNRAFSSAIGAIDSEDAIPSLTAQWIEFTLISPGGAEKTFRRMVLDRIGPRARKTGQLPSDLKPTQISDAKPLIQRTTFMVSPGSIPWALAFDHSVAHLEKFAPLGKPIQKIRSGQVEMENIDSSTWKELPIAWEGMVPLVNYLDMADRLYSKSRSYRSGPLLISHTSALAEDSIRHATDIINNPRRAFSVRDGKVEYAHDLALRGGIWETLLEGKLLGGKPTEQNTMAALSHVDGGSHPLRLLRNEAEVAGLISGADSAELQKVKFAMEEDIARGYWLVAADHIDSWGSMGWWRIDPRTGETLGQYGDGRGADATEMLALLGLVISFGFLIYGWTMCSVDYVPSGQWLCCLGVNGGLFLMGALMIEMFLLGVAWDIGTTPVSGWICGEPPPRVTWSPPGPQCTLDAECPDITPIPGYPPPTPYPGFSN